MSYCTIPEVREAAVHLTTTAAPVAYADSLMEAVIERASRIFDRECGVVGGYFEAAGPATSTVIVYGDGTNYLPLPPYIPGTLNPTISVPDGYTAPEFVQRGEVGSQYLVRSTSGVMVVYDRCHDGWSANVPVTVTARWGFAATPADVKHAVIELVINLLREVDPASAKLHNLDGLVLRERLPPRVKLIAEKYRMRGAVLV